MSTELSKIQTWLIGKSCAVARCASGSAIAAAKRIDLDNGQPFDPGKTRGRLPT
jgi:hypothetical protein